MYYGTDELNQIIDTPNGKALSLRMTFEDGTEITSFKKLRYSGGSNSSSDIAIGTTLSAYVDVSLFDEHNLTNQEFLLEQGAMLQDGTMEYVPIGYFTVQRPNSEDETVDFVAYDRMAKFIKPYVSELTYPTTSDKVLKEVCDMCGVELATTITNPIALESKLDGYLCREVLGFISALHGSFACIDRFGKVNVRWYENEPISKELALVYALDKAQDDYVVEKIEVHKNAETSFTSGSGTRTMYNSNPYATQDSTNAIASKIGGFTYNPSKITMLDDIRLDPWDIVKVVNLDGNEVLIPCMQIEHDFTRGQTSIKSVGATETQTQYNYQGPTVEFMNRIATELLVVNRIVSKSVTTDYLEANYVSAKDLDVVEANIKNAVIEDLSTEFADIHLANIDIADIGTFFADSGILDKVVIENGAVTGELKGVRIVGDVIEANTIKADSLILSGSEDSLIYQINVNSSGLSLEELSDEVYKEKLSGTDLVAKSVTTNELNVDEIFGNSAVLNTITSQEIFSNAIATNKVVVGAYDLAETTNNASGNSILLQDSADGKVIDFSAYGRSEQDGEPTPDTPIDIKSVGDKGYFDGELLQGLYSNTGAFTSNSTYVCSKNPMPCNGGDKVKITYGTTASTIGYNFYDENMNFLSLLYTATATEYEVTAPTNAKYVNFYLREPNISITPITAKHICVTINDKYALIVKNGNKNRLDITKYKNIGNETVTINDNTVTIKAGSYVYGIQFSNDDVGLEVGHIYSLSSKVISGTVSGGYRLGFKDGTYGSLLGANAKITVPKEVSYILYYIGLPYSGTTDVVFGEMQIEESDVQTDYVPHEEQTTYIPIAEPLRSVGEVKDEIVKQDGVWGVLRRIANVVIDENSTISLGTYQGYNRFGVTLASKYASVSPFDKGYCSHMRYSKDVLLSSTADNTISVYTANNGTSVRAYFRMDKFATVDELKTWLADNPITVEYELATETFEPFADQTPFRNITTYNPVTYITNSDDALMGVEYYRNNKTGQELASVNGDIMNWASANDITMIDGGKIYTNSITADKIDVDDLFAQDITASGTIRGLNIEGANIKLYNDSSSSEYLEIIFEATGATGSYYEDGIVFNNKNTGNLISIEAFEEYGRIELNGYNSMSGGYKGIPIILDASAGKGVFIGDEKATMPSTVLKVYGGAQITGWINTREIDTAYLLNGNGALTIQEYGGIVNFGSADAEEDCNLMVYGDVKTSSGASLNNLRLQAFSLLINQTAPTGTTNYTLYDGRKLSDYSTILFALGSSSNVKQQTVELPTSVFAKTGEVVEVRISDSNYVKISYVSDTQVGISLGSSGTTSRIVNIYGYKITSSTTSSIDEI